VPHAIASSTGSPKPSYRDGRTSAAAPLELAGERRLALRPGDDERQPDLGRGVGCGKRVLPILNRADEEQVPAVAVSGAERGIDAVRRDRDLRLRHAVQLDQVTLRPLRDGDHASSPADRTRDDPPEDRPVPASHRADFALERKVVDGDDRRPAPAERQRVLEVRQRRAQTPKRTGHRPRHTQLLRPRRNVDRLDSGRHELGLAGQRGEPELVAGQLGQPA
jgi:hypothetical protein